MLHEQFLSQVKILKGFCKSLVVAFRFSLPLLRANHTLDEFLYHSSEWVQNWEFCILPSHTYTDMLVQVRFVSCCA